MQNELQIVSKRFIFLGISVVFILIGIAAMVINQVNGKGAFNYDIQFTGGTSIEIATGKALTSADVDDACNKVKEITGTSKQPSGQIAGDGTNLVIKTENIDDSSVRDEVQSALAELFGGLSRDAFSIQNISATISGEMVRDSILAVVVSCVFMLIYVSLRFRDFKTGASAIIALVHDALIVLGSYAVFRIPLNGTFIAAMLTIIGYSINDTIVLFDRVRENKPKLGKDNHKTLVNVSVTQTIKRTLFTSLTTFFTVACLYVLGVDSIKQFALPMCVGVICGTYSSIFVACNLWYIFSAKEKKTAK
jgi:preprotein translocase SecF subunit